MIKTKSPEVRAMDLMRAHVVRLESSTGLSCAVETLEESGISGAPVVDATERLVGVFSLRDAARAEHLNAGRSAQREGDDGVPDWSEDDGSLMEDEISDREDYSSASGGGDRVADWMNPAIISVSPDATLKEVCKAMARHLAAH